MIPLILTATIDSGYFGNVETKIIDIEERRNQYHETLEKYIVQSNFDKFVFAENSGTHLDEEYFKQLALKYNKKIEFLTLMGDIDKTKKYGKSYGEAKLIADAVGKSEFLKQEQAFYKVTGRVWIENINNLVENNSLTSQFVAYNHNQWLVTIFFRLTLKDYKEYLSHVLDEFEMGADYARVGNWIAIEKIYYKKLVDVAEPIKGFREYPDFRGKLGGTNLPYTKSRTNLLIRNILNRLGFFKLSAESPLTMKIARKMFEMVSLLFK